MSLPDGFSDRLRHFEDPDFWNTEAKVNGIWNTMLHLTLLHDLSPESFLITPEMATQGVQRLRPDLVVGRLTNEKGGLSVHIVVEGKKADGDGWDSIDKQIHDFFTNGHYAHTWAIGARGKHFRVWLWDTQKLHGVQVGLVNGVLSLPGRAQGLMYDLTAMPQEQLQGLLTSLATVPIAVPDSPGVVRVTQR